MMQVMQVMQVKKFLLSLFLLSLLNALSIFTFADSSNSSNPSSSSTPITPAPNSIDACSPLYGPADFSHKNITLNGPTHCTNGDSNVSVINGPISASNTHFNNPIVINGPIHTNHVIFDQTVVINGPADLINTNFSKSLTVRGPVHAESSNFLGDISLWSDTVKFDHCVLNNLFMHNTSPMKAYFYNQSLMIGDLSFLNSQALSTDISSPKGLAYLDQNSKIHGKINSGKIILWDSSDF